MKSASRGEYAEAVEAGFPDVDRIGNFVGIEWEFTFEAKRVASAQSAGKNAEFSAGCEDLIPYASARCLVGRNVDLESVFAGVARAADDHVEAAERGEHHIGAGQLAEFSRFGFVIADRDEDVARLRALQRDVHTALVAPLAVAQIA